jgi:capsular exopolysaccharide synthesis family protein
VYRSTARIFIKQAPVKALGEQQMLDPEPANFLATQCEVIKSIQVLSRAADSAVVRSAPTFAKAGDGDILSMLRQNLTVSLDKGVDVIGISFMSTSPRDAAVVVNGVVKSYADFYADQNRTAAEELLRTLNDEKSKREAELQTSLRALNDFKRSHGIAYGPDAAKLTESRIAQLAEAQTNAQLETLSAEEHFGPTHPQSIMARKKEQEITALLKEQRDAMMESNAEVVEFSMLDDEAKRIQGSCEQINERIKQVALGSSDSGSSHVAVLDEGQPDFTPVWPSKSRTLALAGLLGFMLGSGLAMGRERMDGSLRDPEAAAMFLRLPLLGVIPQMRRALGVVGRGQLVHLDPMSSVAEAYRKVRTAIFFGTPSGAGQSLLITSPTAGDGKSTTAANLAIAMAQTGERVILVDADFRRPTQHVIFGIKNDNGLTAVLTGRCPLDQAIRHGVVEGLDLMPSGVLPPNPSAILNTTFTSLLEELCGRYDRVVFDSPPLLAVSDARILAAQTHVTILALRAGKSSRKVTGEACAGLASVGARVFGFVMNGARGAHARYGTYGYNYGYPTRRPGTEPAPQRTLTGSMHGEESAGQSSDHSVGTAKNNGNGLHGDSKAPPRGREGPVTAATSQDSDKEA